MDVMYVVSSPDAVPLLLPLLRASRRRGTTWGCFFTDTGVQALDSEEVRDLMSCAAKAVACEFSWERYRHDKPCPVEMGSQTNHSAMAAQARHIVSL
ncbi:MAG TPA: hypothetical protein VKA50_05315 [Gammaproteobacteria bacterium]|nr:hypothetical protein [Gammaproteobacteria bacterium]